MDGRGRIAGVAVTIDLAGRVAVVTGGGRGVGRGIVDRLSDAGATVVAVGRNRPDDLPDDVGFHAADVRDPEASAPLVEAVLTDHGRLDVVVNNAGGSPSVAAVEASPRFSTRIVELNLLAALHVATAAQPALAESRGSVVNITSLSGMRPSPGTAAYGAAKAGLINLTRTLAMEWAPEVRVNAVSAGMVRTEVFDEYYGGAEGAAEAESTVPMGRAATPVEVGDAVVFLASDLASYVTGANLEVHGGGEAVALHRILGH